MDALTSFRKKAVKSGRVDEGVLSDTTEHLLQDLRLIDNEGHLNRAAILMFHSDPEKFVSGAYIKIGFFRDDKGNLEFQDEVHGSLMKQIEKAMDLIKTKYLIFQVSYEGLSRQETPQFPLEALRESLMNCIAHKDYATGIPIQISVSPDHIAFWNAGHLPENWTIENLFVSHPSVPYNPIIANVFFRSGDIESWGRGYKRIIEAVSAYKLLPPKLELISGLKITYYKDIRSQLLMQNVEERCITIVEYACQKGCITNADVQRLLNTNRTTAYRLLQKVDAWLEMKGVTGKNTYYTIKGFPNAPQTLQK